MTVMIPSSFGIPPSFVRKGKLSEIRGMALKLYVLLWHDSERHRKRRLTRTVAQLQSQIGGSRNALKAARLQLVQMGLVQVRPRGADGFTFELCDPETHQPWPGDSTAILPYRRKSSARREPSLSVTAQPVTISTARESAEIAFGFGANIVEPRAPEVTKPTRISS